MLKRTVTAAIVLIYTLIATALTSAQPIPPNVRLNTDASPFLQNEEQVWINLTDSMNVIANWRDWRLGFRRVGVGVSMDGGATWFDQLVSPLIFIRQSDPVLVGDNSGRFFMNMLDYNPTLPNSSHIVVFTSTNGGLIWNGPVPIQPLGPYFEDKQFSAVDRTGGPFDGYYYCSWTRFPDGAPNTMQLVRSTDGGATFDDTIAVGPSIQTACGNYSQGQFSIPIVNSDGSVHVFWQGIDIDSSCNSITAAIRHTWSTDGGATFTPDTVAFVPNMTYWNVDGPGSGINVYGMPNGDADISGGPYDGTIYISQTQVADFITGETDVVIRKSTDNGLSWTTPSVVNDDPPGNNIDNFHPWLIVNEDGTVMMIFYDQRQDPLGHYLFDCYYAASFDGAETFTTNYRLSSESSNPNNLASVPARSLGPVVDNEFGLITDPSTSVSSQAGLIAEYIGVHAKRDYCVAVWTDTRDLTQDVYSARFENPFLKPRLYDPTDGLETAETAVSYRWATTWHEDEDSYRLEVSTDPTFSSLAGSYSDLQENDFTPGTALPTNHYYWRVKGFRTAGDSTEYSDVWEYTTACSPGGLPTLLAPPPPPDTLTGSSTEMLWTSVPGSVVYHLQLATDAGFTALIRDTLILDTSLAVTGLTTDSTTYYWRVNASNSCGTGDWSEATFTIAFCPVLVTGDVDVSSAITSSDIIWLVNYVFKSGPAPLPVSASGDVDCDSDVDSGDIIYLVNHVFKSGPEPCDVCLLL